MSLLPRSVLSRLAMHALQAAWNRMSNRTMSTTGPTLQVNFARKVAAQLETARQLLSHSAEVRACHARLQPLQTQLYGPVTTTPAQMQAHTQAELLHQAQAQVHAQAQLHAVQAHAAQAAQAARAQIAQAAQA
eukprot:CAMPEP_0119341926 /NCGR_PEP_ID=MMETSP1333-20130426/103648_1 /TAXON_ID=418940 /ORGANISM="Scyphosphaera apsteinii, Strain RCC1455" /LENGTH=132 /DNA_ID=CAMNT_0007354029 /DNA_START=306 /DNA_END=702 /DNA_ORIENTATION=-